MRKFRHARRLRGELMSDINITPFVDVLLVLLVSFLISAPLMTLALPIQLPKGKLKERVPAYEESILAVVNKKKTNCNSRPSLLTQKSGQILNKKC